MSNAQDARTQRLREREHRKEASLLIESLKTEQLRHDFIDQAMTAPALTLPRRKGHGTKRMAALVLASDWHVDERVRSDAIAGFNSYSASIAKSRIESFFHGVESLIKHHRASGQTEIRHLVLALMGDFLSGRIHEDLKYSTPKTPIETVLWLLPLLESGIRRLLELDLSITCPCVVGNHGRTTDRLLVAESTKNSYEWCLYRVLAQRLPEVHWEIPESEHAYVQVYGQTVHVHHGHDVRYQGGIGGIGIPLLKRVQIWDRVRKSDLHVIGHWHQLRDYGRALVNSSMIGYNAYAQKIGAEPEAPQQLFALLDETHGKAVVSPIWLDRAA